MPRLVSKTNVSLSIACSFLLLFLLCKLTRHSHATRFVANEPEWFQPWEAGRLPTCGDCDGAPWMHNGKHGCSSCATSNCRGGHNYF